MRADREASCWWVARKNRAKSQQELCEGCIQVGLLPPRLLSSAVRGWSGGCRGPHSKPSSKRNSRELLLSLPLFLSLRFRDSDYRRPRARSRPALSSWRVYIFALRPIYAWLSGLFPTGLALFMKIAHTYISIFQWFEYRCFACERRSGCSSGLCLFRDSSW